MNFVWYLLLGLLVGFIANFIVKGHGSTLWVNLIVGVVGGLFGGWVLSLFGLMAEGAWGTFVSALIGAVILVWITNLLSKCTGTDEECHS